jgi:hypothetical protein
MKLFRHWLPQLGILIGLASGCTSNSPAPPADPETKIRTALEKLDPADRALAQEQKYCAVETENRLGGMGKPYKVMVDNQPVFLCCKGCETAALKDPKKTLAAVKRLKSSEK